MSGVRKNLENLVTDIMKEFFSRFTHDWPPEFYTKEEMPRIASRVLVFLRQSFEKVARGTAEIAESPLSREDSGRNNAD